MKEYILLFGVGNGVFAHDSPARALFTHPDKESYVRSLKIAGKRLLVGSDTGVMCMGSRDENNMTGPVTSIVDYHGNLVAFAGKGYGGVIDLDRNQRLLEVTSQNTNGLRGDIATSIAIEGDDLYLINEGGIFQINFINEGLPHAEIASLIPGVRGNPRVFTFNNNLFDITYSGGCEYPRGPELRRSLKRDQIIASFPEFGNGSGQRIVYSAASASGNLYYVTVQSDSSTIVRVYMQAGLMNKTGQIVSAGEPIAEFECAYPAMDFRANPAVVVEKKQLEGLVQQFS